MVRKVSDNAARIPASQEEKSRLGMVAKNNLGLYAEGYISYATFKKSLEKFKNCQPEIKAIGDEK